MGFMILVFFGEGSLTEPVFLPMTINGYRKPPKENMMKTNFNRAII
jgi:hypothetical protein